MPPDLNTEVAVLKSELQHVRDDVAELKDDVRGMAQASKDMHAANDVRLRAIETSLAQAKGGVKALISAGSIGAAITGAIGGLALKLLGKI